MFVVGLELDISLVKGRGRVAASVSVASILLPFSMGIALAAPRRPPPAGADFWPFALFIGAAMSITAFPVLARILTDRRMHRTETGGLALACAATDDVLAWTLLAVVIGIAGGEGDGPGWLVFLAIPFALFAIFVVRPALTILTRMYAKAGELTPTILSVVLVGLVLFAAATEYLHVHYIFGAFLFGAVMPHEDAAALRHEILVRLEQISVLLLLPVFFLVSGLQVDIRGLGVDNILPLVAILTVAIVGKYVGAYLGARSAGVPHWQANALGILMNTRGLTELIILNVGLELGLLSRAVHDDGDHGAGHHRDDRAAAPVRLPGPPGQPRHRGGRARGAGRRRVRPGAGDRPRRPQQPVAGRAGRGPARDQHARPRSWSWRWRRSPQARGRHRSVRRARRDGRRDGAAGGAGASRRELGVPVRIIANPSADPETDLTELVQVLRRSTSWPGPTTRWPRVVGPLAVARRRGAAPRHPARPAPRIRVAWTQTPDGDAALLLGCRIAPPLASTSSGDGERVERLRRPASAASGSPSPTRAPPSPSASAAATPTSTSASTGRHPVDRLPTSASPQRRGSASRADTPTR